MYRIVVTQSEIVNVVGVTKRYMSNPEQMHWEVVKNIWCLRGTKDL